MSEKEAWNSKPKERTCLRQVLGGSTLGHTEIIRKPTGQSIFSCAVSSGNVFVESSDGDVMGRMDITTQLDIQCGAPQ